MRAALLCARLLVIPALIAPFWFWNNGLLELEATQFVQRYLADRPILQKVFDPHINDIGTYQARELSYFFDYLDARVFAFFMNLDRAIFVPASSVGAGFLTALVIVWQTRRWPAATALAATLLLLLYLTNFIYVVTSGVFYRSTKPLLAPVLIATVLYLFNVLARPASLGEAPGGALQSRAQRARHAVTLFTLLCTLSLLDRQGFFLAVVGLAIVVMYWISRKASGGLVIAAGSAVVSMVVYNMLVGPALIRALNGYNPSFQYQNVRLAEILTTPQHFVRAAEILWQATRVLVGGLPSALAVILLAVALWRLQPWRRARHPTVGMLVVVALPAAFLLMFAIMVARHPAIYDLTDHRLWYYPLPWQALLLAGGTCAIGYSIRAGKAGTALLCGILALATVSNVTQWNSYRRDMSFSQWFRVVSQQSEALKASLQDGRPRPFLSPEYADFYQYCLRLSPALKVRDAATRQPVVR
ncbi:MAG: hypothetical protein H0T71_03740 [Acidobacteria bacterium]|nr:hypothetical protein [Acidobacteriota bacterium]